MTCPRAPNPDGRASRDLIRLFEGLVLLAWATVIVLLIGVVLSSLVPAVAVMTVDLFWGHP